MDEQREAAEEYIAYIAQRDVKPSWWKQFIQAVRTFFKGFYSLDMSDSDIETLIGRAAAKTRRNAWNRSSRVVKDNLTTGNLDGQARFMVGEESTEEYGGVRRGTESYRFAGDEESTGERAYYGVPWAEGMQKAVTEKSVREPVFVSETPEVFRKIGFTSLPMLMNVRHLRLNYYDRTDFEKIFGTMRQGEHAHNLRNKLVELPNALKHPLAIVVNKTQNATPGSVVAITDMDVNGKKIVVPVLIESVKTVEKTDIDSHLVLTVYDSNNWIKQFLTPAIEAEKTGVGIFYFDANKASRYTAYSNKIGNIPTGFVHNIAEAGINVKPQTETLQFKHWFAESKVVDENGNPMVVYHGTNWNMLEEPVGDAVFSDKYRGVGSGDNGFFGRGFYFTFGNGEASKGEAGFYGKNVYSFYLSIQNPFYFSETLLGWNGKRVLGDEVHSVEIVNAVKLFPELLADFTLDTYDKNGDFAGSITLDKYARMFEKVYKEKKFNIRKTSDPNEIVIESDPVEKTEDGYSWTEYKFSQRIYKPRGETDMQLLCTHLYLSNSGFPDGRDLKVDIPYALFREFYGQPEFRSWLENNGYDGVMQSKNGDEVVAFYPTQIKSATDNVGTFDPNNPDIRFAVAPEETEWEKAVISVLRPVVGESVEMEPAEIAARLKELYGLDLSADDARYYAQCAAAENRSINARRQIAANKKRAFEYFEDLHNYFYHFRQAGEGLFINPGKEFEGEEVSGTFISENFRKYSHKRQQRKNESDKQYRKYLQKRREKLDSAEGVSITDLAESYARATGGDAKTIENEMFDFFRDLTVKDILSAYKKHKQELLAFDKAEDARLREEFMAQERERIKDEAVAVIESGREVTLDWIQANRKVYEEVYRAIFKKEAPQHVSQKDLDALKLEDYENKKGPEFPVLFFIQKSD